MIAAGKGATITFTVPAEFATGELVRVTLTSPEGRVYRDLKVVE